MKQDPLSRFRVLAAPWWNCPGRWSLLLLALSLLAGPARAAECRCGSLSLEALRAAVEDGQHQLTRLEPEVASVVLNDVLSRLECLSGVPSPQLLGNAWLLLGISRRLLGDSEGSVAAFSRALVQNPTQPWNGQFGITGKPEFEQAQAALRCARCSRLEVPALQIDATSFVDGQAVTGWKRRWKTTPGRHLLQVVSEDRVVWSGWVETGVPFDPLEAPPSCQP